MLFFIFFLLSASALWPTIPVYKEDAYKMFGGRYIKYISPFSLDRYDSARWNYIERNLDNHLKVNSGPPMIHKKDHKGNYILLEKMHVRVAAIDTSDGLVAAILGFVYGL